MSTVEIRVRFAPSPTGYLHIGGLRTALYNYLFSRKHGGTLVLRIEDTDQSRKVEGAIENLISSLEWAGITFDEGPGKGGKFGPYVQSERLQIYHDHVSHLINEGNAYYCFCTPERLEQMRQKQAAAKLPPMYDRTCRALPVETARAKAEAGETYVVRMKIPIGSELTFEDLIRGKVTIANKVLDDQVLLKSDGFPTYHLAVVVDDHLMRISHVIRGEEWLPSTPKHIHLYKHFGWELPIFAHLPLLLNPDKSKLSKRQGDVAVEDYRAKGYIRDAIINFVALLGWNPGDEREIFTLSELVQEFSLERVGKSGAIFNLEKLNWHNQQHLRLMPASVTAKLVAPVLSEAGIVFPSMEYLERAVLCAKERVTTVTDYAEFMDYLFRDPRTFDEKGIQKNWNHQSKDLLMSTSEGFYSLEEFTAPAIEASVRAVGEKHGVKASVLIHLLRLAVSGKTIGPGLFELLELIGKDSVLRRIEKFLTFMNSTTK